MFGLKKPRVPTHPLGERDLKDLARRLQTLLPVPDGDAPLRLSLDDCKDIIARLHHHTSWADVEQQGPRVQIDPLAPTLLMAKNEASLSDRAYLPLGHQRVGKAWAKSPVWSQTVTQALDQTLVLGSTGAGKTETLVSMGAAALKKGSGLVYFDGKGDTLLFTKMFALAQANNRLDRLFVINFMAVARDVFDAPAYKLSNTLNPMELWGTSDLMAWCATWLTHGVVKPEKANSVLAHVLELLVGGRDERLWALDVQRLGRALEFDGLFELLHDTRLTPAKRAPLQAILNTVLSASPAQPFWAHPEQARAQHAALLQPLVVRCQALANSYGHIVNAQVNADTGEWLSSEIDLDAVLDDRQMMLCLLPALEKSIDELATLGRLVLGGMQVAIARRARRLAQAPVHEVNTLMVVDEAGYFLPPTVNDLILDAPRAGVACVWGSQDLPALQKTLPEQSLALAEACGTKLFMKCEDPSETALFYQRASFRGVLGETQARDERTTWMDLKDQQAGHSWAVSNGHAIPLTMEYVKIDRPQKIWVNRPALSYLGNVQDRPSIAQAAP